MRFLTTLSAFSTAVVVSMTIQGAAFAQGDETEAAYESATWYFQCPTDPITLPAPTPTQLVLEGAGPHYNLRGKLLGTPVTVKGKLCAPAHQPRDIVLVLDVSGSMTQNDPFVNNSCGRLTALNAVLDTLSDVANIGLVTFDAGVQVATTRMHPNKLALLAELTTLGRGAVQNVVCAALGGTIYRTPLQRAEALLKTGRKEATKEIFFLSDGAPTDGPAGTQMATQLKTTGITIDGQNRLVTIGTVMLGTADDSVLRTGIASKDANNQPLHARVADADDLAATLGGMSSATLAGATVSHGSDLNPSRAALDIMPYVQPDFTFEVPGFVFDIDGRQNSYELNFEYWDTNQNRQTFSGRMHWID